MKKTNLMSNFSITEVNINIDFTTNTEKRVNLGEQGGGGGFT
jgi:hypothetical protein